MLIPELQRLGVHKGLGQETEMAKVTEQKLGCLGLKAYKGQVLSQILEMAGLANRKAKVEVVSAREWRGGEAKEFEVLLVKVL